MKTVFHRQKSMKNLPVKQLRENCKHKIILLHSLTFKKYCFKNILYLGPEIILENIHNFAFKGHERILLYQF